MVVDLLAFIAGVGYGYTNPGKEDRGNLLKKGLRIGVGVGIVFTVLNLFVNGLPGPVATLTVSIIGIGFLTVWFIAGTIIGDVLEHKIKK